MLFPRQTSDVIAVYYRNFHTRNFKSLLPLCFLLTYEAGISGEEEQAIPESSKKLAPPIPAFSHELVRQAPWSSRRHQVQNQVRHMQVSLPPRNWISRYIWYPTCRIRCVKRGKAKPHCLRCGYSTRPVKAIGRPQFDLTPTHVRNRESVVLLNIISTELGLSRVPDQAL